MRKNIYNGTMPPNRKEAIAVNLPATMIGHVFPEVFLSVLSIGREISFYLLSKTHSKE